MMKFHGDVRPLSHDNRYMGTAFTGTFDEALAQARGAYDHGLARIPKHVRRLLNGESRDRIALLQHLNLLPS